MYVQALIQYAVFDDAVALLGRHGASLFVVPFVSNDTVSRLHVGVLDTYTKTVPGTLDVTSDPLFNGFNILLAVLQLLPDIGLIAVQDIGFGLLAGLGVENTPTSVYITNQCQP